MTARHVTGHAKCLEAGEHVCQETSGRVCVEPDCDSARLARISEQLDRIEESLR